MLSPEVLVTTTSYFSVVPDSTVGTPACSSVLLTPSRPARIAAVSSLSSEAKYQFTPLSGDTSFSMLMLGAALWYERESESDTGALLPKPSTAVPLTVTVSEP